MRTTPEPAMAQLASASMPHQQSSLQVSCDSDTDFEGEQNEEDSQQRNEQAVSASPATVSTDRQRCSHAVPETDPSPWAPTPTDADIEADMMLDEDYRGPMSNQPLEDMQPSHGLPEDASDDEMVRLCTERCK